MVWWEVNDIYSSYFLIAMMFCRYDKYNVDVNAKTCVYHVYECLKRNNKIDNGIKDCVIK